MLKTILNFKDVEVLSRNQQLNIVGKQIVALCKNWAPIGASAVNYPNYPCAELDEPMPDPTEAPSFDF